MLDNSKTSRLREPVTPPESLIDEKGQAIFGTFDKEIINLNLMDCYRPTEKKISKTIQYLKLTRWEATEIVTKEHAIVTAVYGMGKLGFSIIVLWNRKENIISSYLKIGNSKTIQICKNLINSVTKHESKKQIVKTINDLPNGKANTFGKAINAKKGDIEFNVNLTRLSKPSIVSIPFGPNMPLYSQKDFFKANGYISFNGQKFETDEDSVAIIDDHKGYYPRKAHYDWLTTMGRIKYNGKDIYLALNLTKNQSIDEYNYNENLLWLEDKSYALPPILFDKQDTSWHVYSENKDVDITFTIKNTYKIVTNLGVVCVKYYLPFGSLTGYVKDPEGNTYVVDNMIGIAEDKSTLL